MLIVDAGTGQNAINQVQLFDEAVGLTGYHYQAGWYSQRWCVIQYCKAITHVPIRYWCR